MNKSVFVASLSIKDHSDRYAKEPTISKSISVFSTKEKAEKYIDMKRIEYQSDEEIEATLIEQVNVDDYEEYDVAT